MIERYEFWAQHLKVICSEGISIKAYAQREGLSFHALYYWKKKLQRPTHSKPVMPATPKLVASPGFVAVKIAESPVAIPDAWVLKLGHAALELPAYPDPHWLAELAGIMKS